VNSAKTKEVAKPGFKKQRCGYPNLIFIENLPTNITAMQLQEEFASFGDEVDNYIPNKVAKSGRKFGYVKFKSRTDGEFAIQ